MFPIVARGGAPARRIRAHNKKKFTAENAEIAESLKKQKRFFCCFF